MHGGKAHVHSRCITCVGSRSLLRLQACTDASRPAYLLDPELNGGDLRCQRVHHVCSGTMSHCMIRLKDTTTAKTGM